jgi:hypothetical protein
LDTTFTAGRNASSSNLNLVTPGWSVFNFSQLIDQNYYNTNWGALTTTAARFSFHFCFANHLSFSFFLFFFRYSNQYSRYSWRVSISRGVNIFLLKAMPPILFSVLAAALVWLLDPEIIEVIIIIIVVVLVVLVVYL